tara:strand:- start:1467 stop:1643 length:177 start_codon:yes stop_codon:yes gene_type:complete
MLNHPFAHAGLEDGRIVKAIQMARRSLVCRQPFFSPFWGAIHHHVLNLVVDALEGSPH